MSVKKLLRIVVMVLLFPFIYFVLWFAWSLLGLTYIILFAGLLGYPFAWLGDDEQGMSESLEAIKLGVMPFWAPFIIIGRYIETGIFNVDL